MRLLLPLFGLAVLLSACSFMPMGEAGPQNIALIGPDHASVTLTVEVAITPEERAQGLMHREMLPPDHGMLFMFEESEKLSFWMKDTLIPLDIIFFDPQGKVIGSTTMEPCTEDPCPRYASGVPAIFALEVNAGFVEEHGIDEQWNIALPEEK